MRAFVIDEITPEYMEKLENWLKEQVLDAQ